MQMMTVHKIIIIKEQQQSTATRTEKYEGILTEFEMTEEYHKIQQKRRELKTV